MQAYNREIVVERIKALRVGKGWSQQVLAKKINALIGHEDGASHKMYLGGSTGKETISQLENLSGKRNITFDLALAYCQIFDVSLDYLLGRSDNWKLENNDIKEATGLSNKAIEMLLKISKNHKNSDKFEFYQEQILYSPHYTNLLAVLNLLLENEDRLGLLYCISNYLNHDFDDFYVEDKVTGMKVHISGEQLTAIHQVHIQKRLYLLRDVKNNIQIEEFADSSGNT